MKKSLLILMLLALSLGASAQVVAYKKGQEYQTGDFNYVRSNWLGLYQIKGNKVLTNTYLISGLDSIVVLDSVNYQRIIDSGADTALFTFNVVNASNIYNEAKAMKQPDLAQRVIKLEMDDQLAHLEHAGLLIEKGADQVRNGFLVAIIGPMIGSLLLIHGPTPEAQLAGLIISGGSALVSVAFIFSGTGKISQGGRMLRPSTPIYGH